MWSFWIKTEANCVRKVAKHGWIKYHPTAPTPRTGTVGRRSISQSEEKYAALLQKCPLHPSEGGRWAFEWKSIKKGNVVQSDRDMSWHFVGTKRNRRARWSCWWWWWCCKPSDENSTSHLLTAARLRSEVSMTDWLTDWLAQWVAEWMTFYATVEWSVAAKNAVAWVLGLISQIRNYSGEIPPYE